MRHTNLKHAIITLAILALVLTACRETCPTLTGKPLVHLEDQPLCGLTVPEEHSPWHWVWRTDYTASGVNALVRDGDWLWVATPVDVVRLDLRTLACTRFELGEVRNLLLAPDGRLWAAGGKKLARFDGDHWQAFSTDGYAYNLAFDKVGNLWADVSILHGRGIGTFRYPGHEPPEDGQWEGEKTLPATASKYDCDQWSSRGGKFGSSEECRLLADWRERLASLAPPEGIAPWGENSPVAAETDARLWMLTHYAQDGPKPYNALLSFDGRNWQMFPWPYGYARLVADEARGGVWAGTSEGLIFSDGQSIQKYLLLPSDAVPVGPAVYELAVDGSGRLWVSTAESLLRYDAASDTGQPAEIDEPAVLISPDYHEGLWVVSEHDGEGVSHFDGNTWTHYPFPQGWPCSWIVDILADIGGGLWLSSIQCALQGFNGEVWDEYDDGSRGDLLARGPDGVVYAASPNGIIKRYDGTIWETLPPVAPSRRVRITDPAIGPEGEVWTVLDYSKLVVYRGGEWEVAFELPDERIAGPLLDSRGNVWAGCSQGLVHYDRETWERIERETPFSAINALAEDQQRRIWVGGRDGLSVYDPAKE